MRRADHLRLRGRACALGCVTALVTSLLFGLSASLVAAGALRADSVKHPVSVYPFSGFGGYQWAGAVTQIGSRWRVPTLLSKSVLGEAATWIGAESANGHFIQIGEIVDCPHRGASRYEAFWSDAALNFIPQPIGRLHEGDAISASMTQNSHGWTITLDDPSTPLSFVKHVAYGAGQTFNYADWIQEDPAPGNVAARDGPYPDITNTTFRALRADGAAPHLQRRYGRTLMASGGVIRVPTIEHDDSFTFIRTRGAAHRYLVDARQVVFAENKFNARFVTWRSLSRATRRMDADALVQAFKTGAAQLQSQSWPKASRRDVTDVVRDLRLDASRLSAWSSSNYRATVNSFTAFENGKFADDRMSDALRATLNLPSP